MFGSLSTWLVKSYLLRRNFYLFLITLQHCPASLLIRKNINSSSFHPLGCFPAIIVCTEVVMVATSVHNVWRCAFYKLHFTTHNMNVYLKIGLALLFQTPYRQQILSFPPPQSFGDRPYPFHSHPLEPQATQMIPQNFF